MERTIMPSQIAFHLENIDDYSGNSKPVFRAGIRTAFLHEPEHFFGLYGRGRIGTDLEWPINKGFISCFTVLKKK